MFCQQCGTQIPESAQFCGGCGASLRPSQPPPAAMNTSTVVTAAPLEKKRTSPLAMGCLILVCVVFGLWALGAALTSHMRVAPSLNIKEPPVVAALELELVNYSWHIESGYAILEGQVRNVSAEPLRNVAVVASFFDANGGFITSSDALIAYNPVLPGQTSPFKAMATENPLMKKAAVEFKHLMGGSIPVRRPVTKKSTKK